MIGQTPPEAPRGSVADTPVAGEPIEAGQTPEPDGMTEQQAPREWGGREGPEPTRYGDWEKNGRCIDF
ncbi:DUF1674 domain-containing protein [Lysobacter fragariae]